MHIKYMSGEMDTVLLGFIDQPVSVSSTVSWDMNKIGGSPVSASESYIGYSVCVHEKCFQFIKGN